MKLLIDDANIARIKAIYKHYPIDGVTTNPTILKKCGGNPHEVLAEIRDFIGRDADLHVQVVSTTAEEMISEGKKIPATFGKNTYIKIPSTPEGFAAMQALSADGYLITATAIYTPMQAFLAAKSGANYAAPYVNRIDNLGAGGVETTKTIQNIFRNNGFTTQILAASFKNSQQVQALCEYGIGAATIAPDVIEGLVRNACVTSAVADFTKDFEKLCGEGKTTLDF